MTNIFRITSLPLILFLFSFNLRANPVRIKGNAIEYKGAKLEFFYYSDQLTEKEVSLKKFEIGDNGNFDTKIELYDPQMAFIKLGKKTGFFYLEPGKSYELVFPPREDKTKADILNPFFKEEPVHLGFKNYSKKNINYLIATFDIEYSRIYNEIIFDKHGKPYFHNGQYHATAGGIKPEGKLNTDSCLAYLETFQSEKENSFFEAYKFYRIGYLKSAIGLEKADSLNNIYFSNKKILYNNPAYMEFFKHLFKGYFNNYGKVESGRSLPPAISQKSLGNLKKSLVYKNIFKNDSIVELVILYNLHQEFFDDNYSRSAMLTILDSLFFTTKVIEHKIIAQNIREKVTKLLPGFTPPQFILEDLEGKSFSLSNLKGKYIYLNFCSVFSYTCIQEFELLKDIQKKYDKWLQVVSICIDNDKLSAKRYIENKGYNWVFLHYEKQPKVLKDFDIRAYPTYFLIGKEGKMLSSPAPSPTENFDNYLFKLLRNKKELN